MKFINGLPLEPAPKNSKSESLMLVMNRLKDKTYSKDQVQPEIGQFDEYISPYKQRNIEELVPFFITAVYLVRVSMLTS